MSNLLKSSETITGTRGPRGRGRRKILTIVWSVPVPPVLPFSPGLSGCACLGCAGCLCLPVLVLCPPSRLSACCLAPACSLAPFGGSPLGPSPSGMLNFIRVPQARKCTYDHNRTSRQTGSRTAAHTPHKRNNFRNTCFPILNQIGIHSKKNNVSKC